MGSKPYTDKVLIYGLADPRTPDVIRYVGKTRYPLQQRVRQHIKTVNRRDAHKFCWIRSLLKEGVEPIIRLIEECTPLNWEDRERVWIAFYRQNGRLVNHADGGDTGPDMTGYRHTAESKRRIRMTGRMRGKPTPVSVQLVVGPIPRLKGVPAILSSNYGATYSKERVDKIQKRLKGKRCFPGSYQQFRHPIVCVETGTWFGSINEAARRCGFGRTNIGNAIKNGGVGKGYHWKYADAKGLT